MRRRMIAILTIFLIAILATCTVYAMGSVGDLHQAKGIKIENGKLIDTYNNNKEIGNITPIESVAAGEELIFAQDANALEDTLSYDPLVTEYIVESTPDDPEGGIYFMFGHDGDIFLAFVHTDNMGNGMLKRMTEFCEYQGLVK